MSLRPATAADVAGLADLEEVANRLALAHVFGDVPFPLAEVADRWADAVDDPAVTVLVVDGVAGRLDCVVAHDDRTLRHLAVHPERWGQGLARAAVDRAVASISASGACPRLWCLAANHRALGLYAHLGWVATGAEQPAEWPPYLLERELVLAGSPS
ncbi:GNAT family N-acetyltransferase [Nocardioides rubriscoriae]|uniref:GNAT family N-acetyltransferase n=1 Tax=Nocardioides rubriscoriae TaxID=642762 RepID=UPI0014790369|nr:GNAT family N-acetyltransferase [Nocardioides rubriscoriae]